MRRLARGLAAACFLTSAPTATSASPMLSPHFSTDADFISYLAGKGATLPANERFVAQARSGNSAPNGDYEIGLHTPPSFTNAPPVPSAPTGSSQWSWGPHNGGTPTPFKLSRSGNTLTFEMGTYIGTWTSLQLADLNAIGFRLRSANFATYNATSTIIRGLAVDGTPLGPIADLTAADGGLDFIVIEMLNGDFMVTGEAALSWTANASFPQGSRLGFQIKGLNIPTISEPWALALFAVGLVGLTYAARRKRRTV